MAVDLFGVQNLYSNYFLQLVGVSNSGLTARRNFTLKFNNTLTVWTQQENLGVLLSYQY